MKECDSRLLQPARLIKERDWRLLQPARLMKECDSRLLQPARLMKECDSRLLQPARLMKDMRTVQLCHVNTATLEPGLNAYFFPGVSSLPNTSAFPFTS